VIRLRVFGPGFFLSAPMAIPFPEWFCNLHSQTTPYPFFLPLV
jgi:hypothetical protein